MTFDERIKQSIIDAKKETGYSSPNFNKKVFENGALPTVKNYLNSHNRVTSGIEKLWELKRLDLCFESIIFEPEWHDLFSKEELTEAKNRLKQYGYDVSNLSVEPLNNIKDKIIEDEQNYWILPCNDDNYDIEKAYKEYHTIDWHQDSQKIKINDIVYIYKTEPYYIIRFTCRVKNINKQSSNKKDRDCYIDSTPYDNKTRYMDLEFINRFEAVFPDIKGLKENGFTMFRRLTPLPEKVLKYIKQQEAADYSTKRLDGMIPSDLPKDHWSIVGGDEEELREKAEKEAKALSDSELFEKAKQQGSINPKEKASTTSTYVRNTYVAEASKRRANGICQLCGQPAPFKDKNGNPYLESHHIIWLSEGGADTLENTAALCPNCHRKMHVVKDVDDVEKLRQINMNKNQL